MPDKLTDSEIKKALECCKYSIYEKHCTECLLIDDVRCIELVTKSALDLINRYEKEKNKAWELFKKKCDENTELQMICDKQKAEIERLRNHIQEGIDLAKQIPEMLALAKAEAYKEAFEKVKEELKNIAKIDWQEGYYYLVGTAFFDNLSNKLEGDGDDHK